MALIKVTRQEINKFKTIPPGFYPAQAIECDEKGKPSNSSSAIVFKTTFKILQPEFMGVQIDEHFNTNAGFRVAEFIAAAEKVNPEDLFSSPNESEAELDISKALNKVVGVKVVNEPYQGNMINRIQSFQKWEDEVPFG